MLCKHIHIIGCGLIGSSLSHALKKHRLCENISIYDHNPHHRNLCKTHKIADIICDEVTQEIANANIIILCTPIGTFPSIMQSISAHLSAGTILTDVGSVKEQIIKDIEKLLPKNVHFIPGHPVAGTEFSGPLSGFADLFQNRWCILTPLPESDDKARHKIQDLWIKCGMKIKIMTASEHDLVLGLTSHLPHLIAFTIVGTAVDLQESLKQNVIELSAGGFRDFTRIAASDPTMWRDIFLQNRQAVLDILSRFSDDLSTLKKAVEKSDGDLLFDHFSRTSLIRKDIIKAHQDS